VAPADSVRTDQSDDLLVVEAAESGISIISKEKKVPVPHTVKDVPDMRSALSGIRETAIWGDILSEAINAPWPPWDFGSSHLLDGSDTSKGPQVTVADPRELDLYLLQ
jgi:hypothetical protein